MSESPSGITDCIISSATSQSAVHRWSWMEISNAFSSTPFLNQDPISESESLAWDGRGGKKLNLKNLLIQKI